jgi:hypothetical protein
MAAARRASAAPAARMRKAALGAPRIEVNFMIALRDFCPPLWLSTA